MIWIGVGWLDLPTKVSQGTLLPCDNTHTFMHVVLQLPPSSSLALSLLSCALIMTNRRHHFRTPNTYMHEQNLALSLTYANPISTYVQAYGPCINTAVDAPKVAARAPPTGGALVHGWLGSADRAGKIQFTFTLGLRIR